MEYYIKFVIKKINYRDNEKRYSICKAILKNKIDNNSTQEITVKGFFPILYEGDEYEGKVTKKFDDIYGDFFYLEEIPKIIIPESKKTLAEFINKRVKGLSLKKSLEIVEILGMGVLKLIKNDYRILLTVPKITEKKAKLIYQQLIEFENFQELAFFIQGMGIATRVAIKVYETYGELSLPKILNNPYSICTNGNIKFIYADKIANNLGLSADNQKRVVCAILEYLNYRTDNNGDMCIYRDMVFSNLNRFLNRFSSYSNNNISEDQIKFALEELEALKLVIIEKDEKGDTYIYKSFYNYVENNIVNNIKNLLNKPKSEFLQKKDINNFISYYESTFFTLDLKRKEALNTVLNSKLSIITGGPGTGKTFLTNIIVNCLKYINPKVKIRLLAPTGKASNRMKELIKMESSTIHRGLKINPYKNTELEEITEDVVIIDEASMIDASLFDKLISKINENTMVIIVGDVDQLPSVGAGLILKDLIDSNIIPVVKLNKIFRQSKDSSIILNSHKVNSGLLTTSRDGIDILNKTGSDFIFWKESNIFKIKSNILRSIKCLMEKYNFKFEDIYILTPLKLNEIGVKEINRVLQQEFNPKSSNPEYVIDNYNCFRIGDRVMQNSNNYNLGVFNGDIGFIRKIYTKVSPKGILEYEIEVEYKIHDKNVIYTEDLIDELELSYAMTIHKSQGSEFPAVIMPIHHSQRTSLNRNLIYTGMTRAKEKLIMIGEEEALNYSIEQTKSLNRISRLREKLERLKLENKIAS